MSDIPFFTTVTSDNQLVFDPPRARCAKGHIGPDCSVQVWTATTTGKTEEVAKQRYCAVCYADWMGATFPVLPPE